MSATYDETLAASRDWIRFQIGDRDITRAKLQDEEIDAALAEEPNKYLAAHRCGQAVLARAGGATSKTVGDLSISWGDGKESTYRDHLQQLREEGCRLLLKSDGDSAVLRVL